jgi:hypothetical protein
LKVIKTTIFPSDAIEDRKQNQGNVISTQGLSDNMTT